MKTLIAQLWEDPKVVGDYHNRTDEVERFWMPCLKSAEIWASKHGYDYKQYSFSELEPTLPDLTYVKDQINKKSSAYWPRLCISRLGILNTTEYDRIVILDADVFVWGDPKLYDGEFCVKIGKRTFPPGVFGYPQGAVYYTTNGPEVYQWICEQLKNPGEHLQLIRNYIKYAQDDTIHFTDQPLLSAYAHSQGYTDIDNHIFWGRQAVMPDTFIHFGGTNKLEKFRKFRAAMIYAKIEKFWDENEYTLKSKGIV